MKTWEFIWFVPVAICISIAGVLAHKGIDAWGWFLFVSLFLVPTRSKDIE
jgi:hypothetical protein